MSKLPVRTVGHVYEDYDIYKCIYGREFETKAWEVSKFAGMLRYWLGTQVKKRIPLNVLEAFAGKSEHHPFFANYPELGIQSYRVLDIVPNDNPEVVVGNIRNCTLPEDVNVIFAFYYSLHFLTDERGENSLSGLLEMFTNLHKHLQGVANRTGQPACFITHVGDHEQKGLEYELPVSPSIEGAEFPVPMHLTRLFKEFKADPVLDNLLIRCDLDRVMDRFKGTSQDTIKNAEFVLNGKVVGKLKVKEPFVYKVWAPMAILDIARTAGFTHQLSFRNAVNNYSSDVEVLDAYWSPDEEDDYEDFTVTDIIFTVLPEGKAKSKPKGKTK